PILHKYYPRKIGNVVQELALKVHQRSDRDWFIEFYDSATQFRWSSKNLPEDLPRPDYAARVPKVYDSGEHRVFEVPAHVPLAEGQPALDIYVRTGCSRDSLEDDIKLVNLIMMLASSLIILLT